MYFVVLCSTEEYFVLRCSNHHQKRVACEIEWEVEIESKVLNKSQSILIGTCFFWFIYTLPFETSAAASALLVILEVGLSEYAVWLSMLRSQLCKCWRSDQTMQNVYCRCSFGHQSRPQSTLSYDIFHCLHCNVCSSLTPAWVDADRKIHYILIHTLCLLGTPKLFLGCANPSPYIGLCKVRLRVASKGTSVSLNPCVILCLPRELWTAVQFQWTSGLFPAPCLKEQSPLENTPGSVAMVEYQRFSQWKWSVQETPDMTSR